MHQLRANCAKFKSVLLGSLLLVLLAACGGTAPQTVQTEKPGEFAITALAAFCIDTTGAGVRVEWSGSERADGYVVLRDGTELMSLGAGARLYNDLDGVSTGATVSYVLQAVNPGGVTVTEAVSMTVPADLCDVETVDPVDPIEPPVPPAAVTDFSTSVQCSPLTGVQLTWTAVAGATSYVLERDYVMIAELEAEAVGFLDTEVRPGGSHTYVLKAVNEVGISLSLPLPVALPFADCGLPGPTVAVGDFHSLAVARDGTVWAWGENWDGQLGVGHFEPLLQPVQVLGLDRVTAVAAGSYHSVALDADGQLWAWGYNGAGQLASDMAGAAVPYPIDLPAAVVAVSSGRYHNLAITADGGVWAWGENYKGQAGRDPAVYSAVFEPYRLDVSGVVQVFAYSDSSFLLHADGTVSAFGRNDEGMLGVGHDDDIHVPETVANLTDVIQVAAGDDHALALTSTGEVFVWGEGAQLGMGSMAATTFEPQVHPELSDVKWIAASEYRSVVVTGDGAVLAWGDVTQEMGNSASASFSYEPVPAAHIDSAVAVFAGYEHTVAVLADGSLVAWGFNDEMQLGSSLPLAYAEFVPNLVQQPVAMVRSSWYNNALALLTDGTVLGWGNGYTGVAEAGLTGRVAVPTPVDPLTDIVAVEVGAGFSLALTDAGNVWSWGAAGYGRLGHGDNQARAQPELISGLSDVVQIAAGDSHSLAVDESGAVWAWGRNTYGQLGNGSTTNSSTPVNVAGLTSRVIFVAAGANHSLAVDEHGAVWAWGRNNYGQLGQGNTTDLDVPTQVAAITDAARSVTASTSSSYVLMDDGAVWAMGYNSRGRLGDGTTVTRYVPVAIAGLPADVTDISATDGSVLAITGSGDLFGWGDNSYGQFGVQYPTVFPAPTKLSAPGGVSSAFAGWRQSFLMIGGALYAAGSDEDLMLGMGRVAFSSEPLPVLPEVPLAGM